MTKRTKPKTKIGWWLDSDLVSEIDDMAKRSGQREALFLNAAMRLFLNLAAEEQKRVVTEELLIGLDAITDGPKARKGKARSGR